jgi:hypothetical protein
MITAPLGLPGWDLIDYTDEDGCLDRRTPRFSWRASSGSVEIERGLLVFQHSTTAVEVTPSASLLTDFTALPAEPDKERLLEKLLSFARDFGPLGFCKEHKILPITHRQNGCPPNIRLDPPATVESIQAWLFYAVRLRTVLNFTACLWRRRPVRPEDWAILSAGNWGAPGLAVIEARGELHLRPKNKVPNRRVAWLWVARNVDYLLSTSGLRPVCRYQRPRGRFALRLEPSPPSLFGSLAFQTMLLVCRSDGMAICVACGMPYPPPRRPRADQRTYCQDPKCRRAAVRDATRDYRERQERKGVPRRAVRRLRG